MPVSHVNRKGRKYFLHEGKTSTGKPKYYFSQDDEGTLVDEIPAGYAIFEKPDSGQVYLRKSVAAKISEAERQYVQDECRRLADSEGVLVSVEHDALVVYTASEAEIDRTVEMISKWGGMFISSRLEDYRQSELREGRYDKMLRFTPTAADRSLYHVERWCFRGFIDNWISIGAALPLQAALETYAPHLQRESFFELTPW